MVEPPGDAPDRATPHRARAWAQQHLEAAPWSDVRSRGALLLVSPPSGSFVTPELIESARAAAWLVVDRADVRSLPAAQREPLATNGVLVETTAGGELVAFVVEALELVLAETNRRAIESRWVIAHAEPLHDPLRRLEGWRRAAAVLPRGADERVLRPLYLQLVEAVGGLATGGAPACGEAAAAAYRLASMLETGVHAPIEWLALDAAELPLVIRLRSWLDDLARASGGDAAALARAVTSSDAAVRAFGAPLRERFGAPAWLVAPTAYSLRAPR